MLRLLRTVRIDDGSSGLLATVVGYRRRFKWVIDDGTGFIGDSYRRWIGFFWDWGGFGSFGNEGLKAYEKIGSK